jgi:uncharacterized membrane protein
MSSLPLHPLIVHTPVALLIVSALFELVGRATDVAWWRKAAFAMLIVGVLGAAAAVLTGGPAGDAAEKLGVPEPAVDAHEEMAQVTLWVGVAAVLARAVAGRMGAARGAMATLGLLLHLAAAVTVGVTGFRGGKLVFDHGAGVRVNGQPVTSGAAPAEHGEHGDHGEAPDRD